MSRKKYDPQIAARMFPIFQNQTQNQTQNNQNSVIHGRKLTQISKAGAISYAKAIKDLLPDADLSKYQGKPTTYWKLS